MRPAIAVTALGAALLVAGCGQKGPLYLPDKDIRVVRPPATQPQPSAPETAPAETAPVSPAKPPVPQSKPTDENSEDSGAPK